VDARMECKGRGDGVEREEVEEERVEAAREEVVQLGRGRVKERGWGC
jgi:hypothetical protein